MSAIQLVAYFVTIVPSLYFLYMVLRAAYYDLKRDDSDILEG
jgi:hypothetical protein